MDLDQASVFGVILATLVLFLTGRLRYDLIAMLALLTLTLLGIVPMDDAFTGFGHPAVVAVAAVLIVSRGLLNSGLIDIIAGYLSRAGDSPSQQVPVLTGSVAGMSGFMNNVGALALLMPVAIRLAKRGNNSPALLLMPLAFGSLLGGLITLIGTPPNIIVSTFRDENIGEPFRMFDFTPIGVVIAFAGVIFVSTLGWRLLPKRDVAAAGGFDIKDYITELRIPPDSSLAWQTVGDFEALAENRIATLSLVRGDGRRLNPTGSETLLPNDILLVKTDSETLEALTSEHGLELAGSEDILDEEGNLSNMSLAEAVVVARSPLAGRTAMQLRLRRVYGVNLIAVARQGEYLYERLPEIILAPGDVVLLQGPSDTVQAALGRLGCLPLAERPLNIGQPRRAALALGIFAAAVVAAAVGLAAVQVAFAVAAVAMVLTRLLSPSDVYESVDWPIVILLGAMIPVARSLESTGAADLVAVEIVRLVADAPVWVALALILAGTMFLSDLVNNTAAALVMSPIALSVTTKLGESPDMFLMAVAIGASSAFLTPIGHQANTLVMGPGGYKFSDYARMGAPVEALIIVIAVPMLLLVWG